ncbi:hypothetical protein ACA910_010648 [Epithemia clementina (nom. ined.)]
MQSEHLVQSNSLEGDEGASASPGLGEDDVAGGSYAEAYGGDGGIQAFVADDEVVDALDVEVILTEEEEELLAAQKQRRIICYVLTAFILVAAIVVPVSLTAGGSSGSNTRAPTDAPSAQPSSSPSAAPTDGEFPPVVDCLSNTVGLTSFENFQDRGSAQWKALSWIVKEDEFVRDEGLECPQKRYVDRYALATIFFEMNGENWLDCGLQHPDCTFNRNQFGWLSNHDVCDWHQLECAQTNVTSINFGSQFPNERDLTPFIGTFPSEIRQLTDLVQINLKEALTEGPIPQFFEALSNLKELNLESNRMTGPLPTFFSGDTFPSLQILVLTDNMFSGTIPSSHGTLSSLLQYRVASNKLTGAIPPELSGMQDVAYLDLADNELIGDVPTALFELTELRILSLHNNDVVGTIPENIDILVNLERLKLNSTQFTGVIPSQLYSISNLREINLRNARFSGIIDPSIVNATVLQIFDIGVNINVGGSLPNFHELQFLEKLRLDYTRVTGALSNQICNHFGTDFGELADLLLDCTKVLLPADCSECERFCVEGCVSGDK